MNGFIIIHTAVAVLQLTIAGYSLFNNDLILMVWSLFWVLFSMICILLDGKSNTTLTIRNEPLKSILKKK